MAQKISHILYWQFRQGNRELTNLNVRNLQDIPLASGECFIGSIGSRLKERLNLNVDLIEICIGYVCEFLDYDKREFKFA